METSKYFSISGYWKDDKNKFKDYIVKELEYVEEEDEDNDDDIFYYGLSEEEIKQAMFLGYISDLEFIITSYEEINL